MGWSLEIKEMSWVENTAGEVLLPMEDTFPAGGDNGIRLYTLEEVREILGARGVQVLRAYGDYSTSVPSGDGKHMLVVCSRKRA